MLTVQVLHRMNRSPIFQANSLQFSSVQSESIRNPFSFNFLTGWRHSQMKREAESFVYVIESVSNFRWEKKKIRRSFGKWHKVLGVMLICRLYISCLSTAFSVRVRSWHFSVTILNRKTTARHIGTVVHYPIGVYCVKESPKADGMMHKR